MCTDEKGGFFIGELRPDEDFDTSKCNRVARFDADRVDAELCHITAGAGVEFTPEELRDWLRAGRAPDKARELAVSDALMELGCVGLRAVAENSGASIRDMARFIRRTGPRHWTTVWFLNGESRTGNDELPVEIDKHVAAGDIDWWI